MTLNDLDLPERRRLARSAGAGGVIWLAMLIGLSFVPVERKPIPEPDFPPVHLTLTSPSASNVPAPVTETRQQAELPAVMPASDVPSPGAEKPAPAAPQAAKKAVPAKTAAPAKNAAGTPKPATAKTPDAKAAAKPAAPASTGLGIPDFTSPVNSSVADSGAPEFLDFSTPRSSDRPASASVPAGGRPLAELEGRAATVTASSSAGASVSSKTSNVSAAATGGGASAETSSALRAVEGAAMAGTSEGAAVSGRTGTTGPAAGSGANVATSTAGRTSSVAVGTIDGISRKLLDPADPQIILPENLVKSINGKLNTTVTFTVRRDGQVQQSSIKLSPPLPEEIQGFVISQVSKWRFESGDQDGQARFSYSIKME